MTRTFLRDDSHHQVVVTRNPTVKQRLLREGCNLIEGGGARRLIERGWHLEMRF